MLPRGRRLRRKVDSVKPRSGYRDGHQRRSWRRLPPKTAPRPTWQARSSSSQVVASSLLAPCLYSDQQIAFRAGVTLRAIAGRRLGQLENNQATVFCARRDRKNFSGSRGAGLCVYFRLMAHSTRRAFKSHGRAGSGRLQSNALRSKHRYIGRRARERSVQAQPTPSAEDRFPRLPPKGRFALSPRRQRRTGSCANATWPAASGRAFIPLAIGSWVGSDRKTRGREPSFHSAVNSLASDGGSAAGRPDRWLRNLVSLVSRQRRKDWRSVRNGACVWIVLQREGAARQTLSPGDRAIRGSRR